MFSVPCRVGGSIVLHRSYMCRHLLQEEAHITAQAVMLCKDLFTCLDWLRQPSWAQSGRATRLVHLARVHCVTVVWCWAV
jgi:hypothetical protein